MKTLIFGTVGAVTVRIIIFGCAVYAIYTGVGAQWGDNAARISAGLLALYALRPWSLTVAEIAAIKKARGNIRFSRRDGRADARREVR